MPGDSKQDQGKAQKSDDMVHIPQIPESGKAQPGSGLGHFTGTPGPVQPKDTSVFKETETKEERRLRAAEMNQ